MIEPFSLSTFLLTLGIQGVVNSIVQSASESASLPGTIDKIIGGFIGNNTNDAIHYVMKNVWQRMHQGGPPVNQDLQKAVRKAYLLATLGLCEGFWQQSGVASQFLRRDLQDLGREDVKWVDRLRDRFRKELKQLPKSKYIPLSTEAEQQVELFLAQPDNPDILHQFRSEVQQNLIQYLRQTLGEPPNLFLQIIENGWEVRHKGEIQNLQWFELLSTFFAEELKTNDRLRAIFQGQLLADLKVNGISVTVDSIETALDGLSLEMSDRLTEISQKVGEVREQIDTWLPALVANSETWQTALQDQLNRIEQQSNRRTLAEKYAGIAVAERVEQIATKYTQRFVGRESEFAEIDRQLRENCCQPLLVTAEAGYGKSALLANWRELRQGDGCFIAYHCFNSRGDETRSLLNGYLNLLRQFYLYYQLENEPLPRDVMGLQDILWGLLRERKGKPTEPLIIILDGLDEADRPVEGVFLDNLPENILILASVRATPDELPDYLPRWAKKAQRLHLHRLDPAAIPQWVKQAGEGELAPYATNSGFIQELDETTAGFPLYLQYLLDELVQKARTGEDIALILHRSPQGFSEYVKEQFRQLAQEDCIRQQPELKQLFAIVSVALGGLSRNDIQALTGLTEWDFPNLPWQITRWFTVQGETYSFTHPQLAREFQTFLGKEAEQAQQKLIDYCAQWQQYLSPYALRYYAAHLSAIKNWQGLYLLVRNQEFRRVQRQELPEEAMNLVLQTVQLALQGSAETDDAGAMAEFLLLHSRRREEILHESPLQALRNGSIIKAWQLADLYYDIDIQRCILWYLLLAWELKDEGRLKEAEETLQKLQQKNFPHLLRVGDWQGNYAASLLTCVFEVNRDICEALYSKLFEDDYWKHLLVSYLINAGDFTRAIEVARHLNSVLEQIVKLETIAKAQKESKDLEGAKATLAIALQVADKIFPDSRWIYSIFEIVKLQIETGDERAKKDTLIKARKKMIAIKNIRNRTHLSVLMANLFSSIGEVKAALKILKEIEGEDQINDSSIFMLIAEVQLQCGETEKAKNTYARAKAIARNKEDSRECYAALVNIVQSQALMKDWDAAFETSEEIKIEQEWYYSEALFRIARKQLQEENWNLQGENHPAIPTIDKIKLKEWKVPALQMLVELQAVAHKFDDALKSAKSISSSLEQSLAFKVIAIQQAKVGKFQEAVQTIEEIQEQQYQQYSLIGIAQAYAQNKQFSSALEVVFTLDSPARQVETLGAIAKIQVQFSENKEARDTFVTSLKISQSLEPSYLKAFALMQIAEEQLKEGKNQQGSNTVDSAYEISKNIPEQRQQIEVKIEIAEIYKQLGKLDKAKDILERMRQATDQINPEQLHRRWTLFAKIAQSQARIGEVRQSLDLIDQIHLLSLQSNVLKVISQFSLDDNEKSLLNKSLNILKGRLETEIKNPVQGFRSNLVQVWTNIAVTKILLGETQIGLEIFTKLCEQAKENKNSSQILSQVAAAEAEAGEITRALATSETIKDEFDRIKALNIIASFQWKNKDTKGIEKTLETAVKAKEKIQDESKQLQAMGMIAKIQVRAGKGEKAVEILNSLQKDRNYLITIIASLFATVNDRKNFKQLLVPAALSLETAYPMCGYLAQLYPEQAAAVAAQVEKTEV